MASLIIRTSDDAIDIDVPDLDDEALATILVTIDESLERRAGLWLHSQDFEGYGQPNRMFWLSADQLDIKAHIRWGNPATGRSFGDDRPRDAERRDVGNRRPLQLLTLDRRLCVRGDWRSSRCRYVAFAGLVVFASPVRGGSRPGWSGVDAPSRSSWVGRPILSTSGRVLITRHLTLVGGGRPNGVAGSCRLPGRQRLRRQRVFSTWRTRRQANAVSADVRPGENPLTPEEAVWHPGHQPPTRAPLTIP